MRRNSTGVGENYRERQRGLYTGLLPRCAQWGQSWGQAPNPGLCVSSRNPITCCSLVCSQSLAVPLHMCVWEREREISIGHIWYKSKGQKHTLANLFCKGPDRCISGFEGLTVSFSFPNLLLHCKSNHRFYGNKWMELCFSKGLFTKNRCWVRFSSQATMYQPQV